MHYRHRPIGIATYYKCKYNKRIGYKCSARLCVVRPENSNVIRVEKSNVEHTHEATIPLVGPLKLTEEAKTLICDQLTDGKTPQKIRNIFQDVCAHYLIKT
jgi:hypothetical protein